MILPRPLRERAFAGEVTAAVRRWRRPTVKAGGTLRTASGVLAIDSVDRVRQSDLTAATAAAAGYRTRRGLIESLAPAGDLYLITFHPGGSDPRVALRERTAIDAGEREALTLRLEAMDGRSPCGPWTAAFLDAIAARPATRAPDLAARLGWETKPFKANVRKLKELGLTESLEVGYRLSPRGRAFRP